MAESTRLGPTYTISPRRIKTLPAVTVTYDQGEPFAQDDDSTLDDDAEQWNDDCESINGIACSIGTSWHGIHCKENVHRIAKRPMDGETS